MDAESKKNPPPMIMVFRTFSFFVSFRSDFLFGWSLQNSWPAGLTKHCYSPMSMFNDGSYCYSFQFFCLMLVSSLEAAIKLISRWFPSAGSAYFDILLKLVLPKQAHLSMYHIFLQ